MGKLNEYISRRANKEEGITGRFWEGRFKSSRLSDAAAVVACMAYVDLNPIRAKMAESLEDSEYTSAQSRMVAELARKRIRNYQKLRRDGDSLTERQEALLASARKSAKRASWLVSLNGPDSPLKGLSESTYLQLVDWTGRQIRRGKHGRIPDHVLPILEGLEINTRRWVRTVERYGSLFHRLVARAEEMADTARAKGCRWFHGVRTWRELYVSKVTIAPSTLSVMPARNVWTLILRTLGFFSSPPQYEPVAPVCSKHLQVLADAQGCYSWVRCHSHQNEGPTRDPRLQVATQTSPEPRRWPAQGEPALSGFPRRL